MTCIFMDESGDMGFSKKSSKWFLFTIALTSNPRLLEKAVIKVWKPLKKKHKKLGELHAFHQDEVTRKRMLRALSEIDDLKVFSVILNKKKVHIDLQNQKNYLYNYTANVILDRLIASKRIDRDSHIFLVVDRKYTKKNLRENFITYITEAVKKKRGGKFEMTLAASHDEKGLQAVDFISWAIFRKYERGDYEFYEIIKDKIIDERLLFA